MQNLLFMIGDRLSGLNSYIFALLYSLLNVPLSIDGRYGYLDLHVGKHVAGRSAHPHNSLDDDQFGQYLLPPIIAGSCRLTQTVSVYPQSLWTQIQPSRHQLYPRGFSLVLLHVLEACYPKEIAGKKYISRFEPRFFTGTIFGNKSIPRNLPISATPCRCNKEFFITTGNFKLHRPVTITTVFVRNILISRFDIYIYNYILTNLIKKIRILIISSKRRIITI